MLDSSNTKVLSWMRTGPGKSQVVVTVNFTAEPQTVNLGATGTPEVRGNQARTLLKSPGVADPESLESVALPAFGVYIGEVK
jgi:alpha-glucosidase